MSEALPDPRPLTQRRTDTEHRLAHDVDVWVATASASGEPHLVPLSFDWDGQALLIATPVGSITGRNLAAARRARLALGHTRDVCMIDGDIEVIELEDLGDDRAERFVERTEFDPRRESTRYAWFRIAPTRIQAWREVNEMPQRLLMRDGVWLA